MTDGVSGDSEIDMAARDQLLEHLREGLEGLKSASAKEFAAVHGHFSRHTALYENLLEREGEMRAVFLEAIEKNARAVAAVAASVEGIVKIESDIRAAARVGDAVERLIWRLGKWGVIGAGVVGGITWLVGRFASTPPLT